MPISVTTSQIIPKYLKCLLKYCLQHDDMGQSIALFLYNVYCLHLENKLSCIVYKFLKPLKNPTKYISKYSIFYVLA